MDCSSGCSAVSTHSHPKVAGWASLHGIRQFQRFNTQPPEGGWSCINCGRFKATCFNTQPPEGGWAQHRHLLCEFGGVSTHSHPKVAGPTMPADMATCSFQHTATRRWLGQLPVSPTARLGFNTQPPEGGWQSSAEVAAECTVSTHSHPKVAGVAQHLKRQPLAGFNTQPPEGGWGISTGCLKHTPKFQHTATRRWLGNCMAAIHRLMLFQHTATRVAGRLMVRSVARDGVSTHSHPKVAGPHDTSQLSSPRVSTHSHPKVAGKSLGVRHQAIRVSTHSHPKVAGARLPRRGNGLRFQHTATRRWLGHTAHTKRCRNGFQHTATRRWLAASSTMTTEP